MICGKALPSVSIARTAASGPCREAPCDWVHAVDLQQQFTFFVVVNFSVNIDSATRVRHTSKRSYGYYPACRVQYFVQRGSDREDRLSGKHRRYETFLPRGSNPRLQYLVEKQTRRRQRVADLRVKIPFHKIPNPERNVGFAFNVALYEPIHILDPFTRLGRPHDKPTVSHFLHKLLQRNWIVPHVNLTYERIFGISSYGIFNGIRLNVAAVDFIWFFICRQERGITSTRESHSR